MSPACSSNAVSSERVVVGGEERGREGESDGAGREKRADSKKYSKTTSLTRRTERGQYTCEDKSAGFMLSGVTRRRRTRAKVTHRQKGTQGEREREREREER